MSDPTQPGVSLRDSDARRAQEAFADKYRLIRPIAEGAMGVVYEAQHTVIGRRVAIKVLQPRLADNPEIIARFRREAQTTGGLENENIGAVTDFGFATDGSPFIVMEFLEGENLAARLEREGAMPASRAVSLVLQAARGLVAAHAHGIVHRDLKPENIFLARRGDGSDLVKILDFGIAKLRDAAAPSATLTREGAVLGTPYYMSPEQARGLKDVDERADVYALGVILYEMLTGRRPYSGESYNQLLFAIVEGAFDPLERLRPDLPPGLPAIVSRAMATDRSQRHASVAELARDLLPFGGLAVSPSDAPRFAPPARASTNTPTADGRSLDGTERHASGSPGASRGSGTGARPARGRSVAVVAGVVAGIALVGAAVLLLRARRAVAPDAATPGSAAASAPASAVASTSAAGASSGAEPAARTDSTSASADVPPGAASTIPGGPPARPEEATGHDRKTGPAGARPGKAGKPGAAKQPGAGGRPIIVGEGDF